MASLGRATAARQHRRLEIASGTMRIPGFFIIEALLFVLVVALALVVYEHKGPLPGDVGGSLGVQHVLWGRGALTKAVDDVSTISWPIPGTITVAVVTGLLLLLRQWLSALLTPLSVGAADGSNYLISQFVKRPRPTGHGIHVLSNIKNYYSFPSGHVLYAVVFFGFLIFLTVQARRRVPWLWPIIVVLTALVVLMPFSRVLEGEHWPSDVIEALLWGCFWLLAAIQVYLWAWERWPALRRHSPEPVSPTEPQLRRAG
jgi:membrane-associated phospholipid phosphatase